MFWRAGLLLEKPRRQGVGDSDGRVERLGPGPSSYILAENGRFCPLITAWMCEMCLSDRNSELEDHKIKNAFIGKWRP